MIKGTFSFANWPFAFKILWAPLIDSLYIKKIGRRKTWICLCTLLTGIILIGFSSYVEELLNVNRIRKNQGK
jgi:PAT family acetyl-CoA transporter-like MFS transporter 1